MARSFYEGECENLNDDGYELLRRIPSSEISKLIEEYYAKGYDFYEIRELILGDILTTALGVKLRHNADFRNDSENQIQVEPFLSNGYRYSEDGMDLAIHTDSFIHDMYSKFIARGYHPRKIFDVLYDSLTTMDSVFRIHRRVGSTVGIDKIRKALNEWLEAHAGD